MSAAPAQLRAMAAGEHGVRGAGNAMAASTYRQGVGDGSSRNGDDQWPALLRRADRLSPGFRD